MPMNFMFSMDAAQAEDGLVWLEAMPAKTWHTDMYGEVVVTEDKLRNFVTNFNEGVRGQEIATNYDHGMDRAKGNKASGWFKKLDIRNGSLWAGVQFTDEAKAELQDGAWRYFSLEWDDEWTHPETQAKHADVVVGGALTNRPVAKGMCPINFSELFEFATKEPYGPDASYADPGYRSDKKKRYPLNTEKRIRAAWSYINMPKNAKFYNSSQLGSIKAKIRSAMKGLGAKLAMAEVTEEWLTEQLPWDLVDDNTVVDIPEEELEGPVASNEDALSDPGTPLVPGLEEVGDISGGADKGWRRETPPAGEDGTVPDRSDTVENRGGERVGDDVTPTLDDQLREALGLDPDADIVKAVTDLKETVKPLETVTREMSESKAFAEQYPEQAAELEQLRRDRIDSSAKSFAESWGKTRFKSGDEDNLVETGQGFSGLVVQKIESVHKKFSEGSATLADFEDVLNTISTNGIVDFKEHGSAGEDEIISSSGSENPRIVFAEMVQKKINSSKDDSGKPTMEFSDAVRLVAEEHPDLAKAYQSYKPAA